MTDEQGRMGALVLAVEQEYQAKGTGEWRESPYRWLRHVNPQTKASAATEVLVRWLASTGIVARRGVGHATSIVIDKEVLAVKVSLCWDVHRVYAFQQIRQGTYDRLLLYGIAPTGASIWLPPQSEAWQHSRRQHAEESRMIQFPAIDPPEWLLPYGGSLDRARDFLVGRYGVKA